MLVEINDPLSRLRDQLSDQISNLQHIVLVAAPSKSPVRPQTASPAKAALLAMDSAPGITAQSKPFWVAPVLP